jgi:proline iminopeptidase
VAAAATTLLIPSGTARLFTLLYPNPGADTVVLLHGGPGVPTDFSPIPLRLARQYQVVVFEQRGTRRSPAPQATYAIGEYLEDIDAIARHLGVGTLHLFGHSWGGLYAQLYAQHRPQRVSSLFLCSPSPGTGALWRQAEREVMAFSRERASAWEWFLMGTRMLRGMMGSDRAYRSLFRQVLQYYLRDFDPSFIATEAMVENIRAEPINRTRARLAAYPALAPSPDPALPVLVSYGQRDIYGTSRQALRARLPHAAFVEIEQAGHLAWRQNPSAFLETLGNFYRLP